MDNDLRPVHFLAGRDHPGIACGEHGGVTTRQADEVTCRRCLASYSFRLRPQDARTIQET